MFKDILSNIACRIYFYLKSNYDQTQRIHRNKILKKICIVESGTIIGNEANIQNGTGDPQKIIIRSNCWIRGHLLVFNHGGCIEIGMDSFISEGCKIWSSKCIKIGNRVLISHNVNIHDNISHPLDSKLRHEDFKHIFSYGLQPAIKLNEVEIEIEDDVWIGFNSTIMKGVKIGRGAIIGANTIVTKNIPEFAVVVGNPARIIKYTT